MRLIFALAALLLLATFAPPRPPARYVPPAVSLVTFTPVPLDRSWPGRASVGRLRFLGGWRLASNDARFGGLSAMQIEGREILAFSDSGWRFRFPLPDGRRQVDAEIGALPEGPGSGDVKRDRDIESLWTQGQDAWVAFERRNVVWHFTRPAWHRVAAAAPEGMRNWSDNRGPEAMVRLADGRFVIFSEGRGYGGPALIFRGDPAVRGTPSASFLYRPPEGYRATDAALLPGGRLLLLNRRFAWLEGLTAKLTLLRVADLRPGATVRGVELADLRPPLTVDNMEALSVTEEAGRPILWMASDDNYNPLQRTLLMKFTLDE